MRPSKSIPSLSNNTYSNHTNNYHQHPNNHQQQHQLTSQSPNSSVTNWTTTGGAMVSAAPSSTTAGPTSPICRCRVMYLGSSVPLITKDGLQGIQEPLRKLYPMDKVSLDSTNSVGIDSWLSVWSNGILIENVDDNGREVKRFFKIGALHYCAAVKYIPATVMNQQSMYSTLPNNATNSIMQHQNPLVSPRFLPLDSPYARQTDSSPPIFASILRRTTGIKVLECHAFICKREAAANALVRCCFHAYADTMYAKQIGADVTTNDTNDNSGTSFQETEHDFCTPQDQDHRQHSHNHDDKHRNSNTEQLEQSGRLVARNRSKSIAALNEAINQHQEYRAARNDSTNNSYGNNSADQPEYCSLADNQHIDDHSISGRKSSAEQYELDYNGNHSGSNLKKQHKFSKSMHYLNYQNGVAPPMVPNGANFTNPILVNDAYPMMINPSTSVNGSLYNHRLDNSWSTKPPLSNQPFYNNPYASRVPSYPPQEQIESANGGGTLKSIRSMAANSIASTLLRSKRHAKSMAQLNKDKIISFHQPQVHHMSSAHTMMGPVMLPPVPPMFLPNLPAGANGIINGSQTMKLPNRSMVPMMMSQPMNFETMTPKELKKLLKKSAKYGINVPNFNQPPVDTNGLPMLPMPRQTPSSVSSHLIHNGSDGALPLRPPSIYSDLYNGGGGSGGYGDMSTDMVASMQGLPPPTTIDRQQMTPILVKPNQEFLKSKAGKKWLKQQKEFKKLLPPHLDGLPIIFGPPPPDALEPHTGLAPGRNIVPGCDNNNDNRHRIYY